MSYASLADLQDSFSLWLPKPKTWRLVAKPVIGQINGLPKFRGLAVATNGIHVAIVTSANFALIGHLGWFVKDPTEKETDLFDEVAAKPTNHKVSLKGMEELFV